MKTYLDIINTIINQGEWKENRTGVDCLTTTSQFFNHNMQDGFPLLTTKKMSLKNVGVELEAFIGGINSKQWFRDRKCNIWEQWESRHKEDSIGASYGFTWRCFNVPYFFNDAKLPELRAESDQLSTVINTLKTNPNDRRMLVTAWNPLAIQDCALPACHVMFILQHINGKLSLNWTQRSVDSVLGLPYNIASYGLLLELIAKHVGMQPHMLSGNLVDCHIYRDQLEGILRQTEREPRKLPKLVLPDKVDIFKWEHKQFQLDDYDPYPAIKFPVAV